MNERKFLIALIVILVGLVFLERRGSLLFEPDEVRYAEIPREMLASKDFITPTQNGSHYFEKPPLLYWLNAASIAVLGENPFAARLMVKLAALGTVLILIFGLSSASVPNLGLWAALFYISAPIPFALSRINITDGLLSFCLTAALFLLRSWFKRKETGQSTVFQEMGLGTVLGLAMLTKGLIGILFPALTFLGWVGLYRKWHLIPQIIFSWVAPLFLAITLPWFILIEIHNPGFSQFFFIHEHLKRFTTNEAKRPGPIYYFILTFILGFFPWTIFFWDVVVSFFKSKYKTLLTHTDEVLFGLWFLIILAFFSLSHSKLIPYLLPAFPAAAALLALHLGVSMETKSKYFWANAVFCVVFVPGAIFYNNRHPEFVPRDLNTSLLAILFSILIGSWLAVFLLKFKKRFAFLALGTIWVAIYFILILAIPILAPDYSTKPMLREALKTNPDLIVAYHCYPESLPWVLKHPVPVVEFQGELASDQKKDSKIFWNASQFWDRWNSEERMVAFVRIHDEPQFYGPKTKKPFTLARNRRYLALTNTSPL